MNTAKTKIYFESNDKKEAVSTSDPFAVDIFSDAPRKEPSVVISEPVITPVKDVVADDKSVLSLWSMRLPKLSLDEVKEASILSGTYSTVSSAAVESLIHTLATYTKIQPKQISVDKVLESRKQLKDFLSEQGYTPCVWLSLAVEPRNESLLVYTNAGFAASIVNILLGGDGTPPSTLRQLSKTERAVWEFLSLCCVRALNKTAQVPLLKLESVTRELKSETENVYGTDFCFRLRLGMLSGVIRIFAPQKTLIAFDKSHNPLFVENQTNRVARFKRIAGDVSVSVLLGETTIEAVDLAALESGDVVLIERPSVTYLKNNIAGKTQIAIGDGQNFTLNGVVNGIEKLRFQIKDINVGTENSELKRSRMVETENANQTQEGVSLNIGQMALTIRVELAAQRMMLEEIASLREGQVIELGCSPTDPVDLVTENGRVARGELVEIEGRLGVKINQVFV